jgi:hypothetical protein
VRGAVTRGRRGRGNDPAGCKGTEAVDGLIWTHAAELKGTEADPAAKSVQLDPARPGKVLYGQI